MCFLDFPSSRTANISQSGNTYSIAGTFRANNAYGAKIQNATGTAQDDHLIGNDLGNYLVGGDGDDILYGGDGQDWMSGGSGADIFVFKSASAFNNIDTISGFKTTQADAIDIADLLVGYDPLALF